MYTGNPVLRLKSFFGQINGFTMTNYGHGNATGDHERKVTPNLGLLGRISFCFSKIVIVGEKFKHLK